MSPIHSTFLLAVLAAGVVAAPSQLKTRCTASTKWPGWDGIKHAFIFGDSYTTTVSEADQRVPRERVQSYLGTTFPSKPPSGNPTYPGWTSSNGPNWVDYLTVKYNASLLQTYNLAVGGATVDSALVKPYLPTVLSVKQQVLDVFMPTYASPSSGLPQWTGSDTLFAFWIGINDVGNSYWQDDTAELNRKIFAVYADVVRTLYADAGARNFLFLNVPPVERSPLTLGQGAQAVEREGAGIAAFNALTAELASNLTKTDEEEGEGRKK
ncbi:hypothetical protein PG989_014356 [Apiospora arundinis]